ncbi:RagB/SusD family nutrient uptake outer membrane protein [Sphingobacterium tabacisoli]|uniref:RagB/SusD family nutrient uptake outer membrane protein n=1 Tax=Sphingobacterium tabacisoli TaxID=2044855 RepID=A0ABW5KXT1_9SPHI|nr:RagB/SusD family nutrient uptake outer membrane protein [Sphingobacterium tabacisoli]
MKRIYIYTLGIVALFSCSKQLDVTPPNNITEEQIQELLSSGDEKKIQLVLGGMANNMPKMINFGALGSESRYASNQGFDAMRNLEGNDIVFGTRNLVMFGGDEYNLRDFISDASDKNFPYWSYGWNMVNTANKMLNYIGDDIVNTNKKLQEFKARGLILRAFAYNYLMENYQDAYLQGGKSKLGLSLYDRFAPVQESKARSSSEETYAFIKNDIKEAIRLLKEAGVGFTADKTDFDLGVAYFILAKVSLWTGDWTTTVSACNEILAKYPNLMTEAVYGGKNKAGATTPEFRPEQNGFLNIDINPEVILGFPVGEAVTVHNWWMNCFAEGNGGLGEGFARIDERLYSRIDNHDFRINSFLKNDFGEYTYPTNGVKRIIPSYANLKFAATHGMGSEDKKNVGRVSCYYMRSSEVLLMKAEALAQDQKGGDAKDALNVLLKARTIAGQTVLTCDTYSGMQGMDPLDMVKFQTRLELWGEGGREFYNNKRWNIPVNRASSANHVDKSSYAVSKMTLQIPLDEMQYNNKADQN